MSAIKTVSKPSAKSPRPKSKKVVSKPMSYKSKALNMPVKPTKSSKSRVPVRPVQVIYAKNHLDWHTIIPFLIISVCLALTWFMTNYYNMIMAQTRYDYMRSPSWEVENEMELGPYTFPK